MKTCIKTSLPLLMIAAGLGSVLPGQLSAQTFTTLHSFARSDGRYPYGGLILSGHTLYGTASGGTSSGNGTVFALNTDGTGFTNLHYFSELINSTNSDGAFPYAGLVLSGNRLYGTAASGGSGFGGGGTVFAVNTDGTAFATLRNFAAINTNNSVFYTNSDGLFPYSGLVLSDNIVFGTASSGGISNKGTVFAVRTDGTAFTNLHSFTGLSDGALPYAGLILAGNTLYGTASGELGSSSVGTVFKLNTNGTGFTILYEFSATPPFPAPPANSDGAVPYSGLVLSSNTLYGTAYYGGSSGDGTVFKINTDGTAFTNLHSFTGVNDGANPYRARLVLSGNRLYGTASSGGSSGRGTCFAVNTDGTGFITLYSFTGGNDGSNPSSGLLLAGDTLYGTASGGGSSGNGTVFSLSFRPQLAITSAGRNAILTWPVNLAGFDYTGYTLASTTNLVLNGLWTSVSPGPVVINGQNTVTNRISGPRQFYRLSQ